MRETTKLRPAFGTAHPPDRTSSSNPRLSELAALVGESSAMQELKKRIRRVASTDVNVLITGETGTGKELVARAIHAVSRRRQKMLTCINCGSVPEGLFESELFGYARGAFTGAHQARLGKLRYSDGGTVFLDEVGELALFVQAKLLRVIETHEIEVLGSEGVAQADFRLIAATNRSLEEHVRSGLFRSDLYYRLNVARIHIPPLRERVEDIPLLVEHFLPRLNREFDLVVTEADREVMDWFATYSWPGNVRELKNTLEAAYLSVTGSSIKLTDLPEDLIAEARGAHPPVSERDRLLAALDEVRWNKSKAAEKLHWSRMTLYRKLAKYRLSLPYPPDQV